VKESMLFILLTERKDSWHLANLRSEGERRGAKIIRDGLRCRKN